MDINKPCLRNETPGGVSLENTAAVKAKLLEEMIELEQQRDNLEYESGKVDFSMLQTYKEMIQSRRVLFNKLNR